MNVTIFTDIKHQMTEDPHLSATIFTDMTSNDGRSRFDDSDLNADEDGDQKGDDASCSHRRIYRHHQETCRHKRTLEEEAEEEEEEEEKEEEEEIGSKKETVNRDGEEEVWKTGKTRGSQVAKIKCRKSQRFFFI